MDRGYRRGLFLGLLLMVPLMSSGQPFQGLSISTPYPDQDAQPDDILSIPVTVGNFGLPPTLVKLAAQGPAGWNIAYIAEGRAVRSAYVQPQESSSVALRVIPPADVAPGTYRINLMARSGEVAAELPLNLTITGKPPLAIDLTTSLPTLKGAPSTEFKYLLSLRNKSTRELTIGLRGEAPPGFQVSFADQLKLQQVTTLPVNAGAVRAFNVILIPPARVPAGSYQVTIYAEAETASASVPLTLEVVGTEKLKLRSEDARVSGDAYVGDRSQVKLMLTNEGSAQARNIRLSSEGPAAWTVTLEPSLIDVMEPGDKVPVTTAIQPGPRALAGDYQLTLNATSDTTTDTIDYRVTVRTSTVWGSVGILIVVIAIVVVGFATVRFGRR